jgi:hypothetical protein
MHDCPVGGHQEMNRTVECIKLHLNWPRLEQDVTRYLKQCKVCQVNKETKTIKIPLIVRYTKTTPWEEIYLDIIEPLPTTNNNAKYVLTCQVI